MTSSRLINDGTDSKPAALLQKIAPIGLLATDQAVTTNTYDEIGWLVREVVSGPTTSDVTGASAETDWTLDLGGRPTLWPIPSNRVSTHYDPVYALQESPGEIVSRFRVTGHDDIRSASVSWIAQFEPEWAARMDQ